jgi:hypothetical protein
MVAAAYIGAFHFHVAYAALRCGLLSIFSTRVVGRIALVNSRQPDVNRQTKDTASKESQDFCTLHHISQTKRLIDHRTLFHKLFLPR